MSRAHGAFVGLTPSTRNITRWPSLPPLASEHDTLVGLPHIRATPLDVPPLACLTRAACAHDIHGALVSLARNTRDTTQRAYTTVHSIFRPTPVVSSRAHDIATWHPWGWPVIHTRVHNNAQRVSISLPRARMRGCTTLPSTPPSARPRAHNIAQRICGCAYV